MSLQSILSMIQPSAGLRPDSARGAHVPTGGADGGPGADATCAKGYTRGVKLERKRIAAILDLPETRGRYGAAVQLATTTDLPVSTIREYLRSMPKRSRLAEAMAEVPNPDIGPDWPAGADNQPSADQIAQRIVGAPRAEVSPSKPEGKGE